MSTLTLTLVTLDTPAEYATCPGHVDTVIARMQDTLHETMDMQHGALEDWWVEQHPEFREQLQAMRAAAAAEGGDIDPQPVEVGTTDPVVQLDDTDEVSVIQLNDTGETAAASDAD